MKIKVIPGIDFMGNVDDTALMVDQIRQKFPKNFIGLAGLSMGSAQLVTYIGKGSNRGKIDVAAGLAAGLDIITWSQNLQQQHPWVDNYITSSVKKCYLKPYQNQQALDTMSDVVKKAWTANSIVDWYDYAAPLAGYQNFEHYCEHKNPSNFFQGIQTPCLLLSALDDFVTVKENIRYDIWDKVMNLVCLITDYGGHVCYNEGPFAQGNFMYRVTLDFFDAVLADNMRC